MIKDVSPAIVGVINMQKSTNLDDLFNGKASKSKEAGIGSGVIYQISDGSAYIVTNNHKLKLTSKACLIKCIDYLNLAVIKGQN